MNGDYSNHFLAMLGKLNRSSKTFIFLLALCACGKEKIQFVHTEISCPGRPAVLIRYATLNEVKTSIARDNEIKKKFGTSEDYTVIYASGGRSVKVQKVSPEEILKCSLREIPVLRPDKNITKYTDY